NEQPHCATQFFEGLFNPKLEPGERFTYTFDRAGEYFFNDCTDPRPTGKVEVYLTPELVADALSFEANTLDLSSPTGIFTGVTGNVTARFAIPAGDTFDGGVTLKAPLSDALIAAEATRVEADGSVLVAEFSKAAIDNNVPVGTSVPLVVSATFIADG